MPTSAVLLRVLLILALVLNSIGSAVAAVHAHAGHADGDLPMLVGEDFAPCHDQAPVPSPEIADPGDCCDGARCDCTAAGATLAAYVLPAHAAPPVVLAMHRLAGGHRAPALAHPIRPPIG